MNDTQGRSWIAAGQTALGIELGSTRIKAVLIGPDHTALATGGHDWENQLVDGVWTYAMEDVWAGLQAAYAELAKNVREQYGLPLTTIGCVGISAMMHGYLPFDGEGRLLTRFRTWRNTMTEQAAAVLTELFQQNVPQRWSIAHLGQAILNGEDHVPRIRYLTSLEGYVHWQLTGEKVIGVGEAAGMMPVDSAACNYSADAVAKFDSYFAGYHLPWTLAQIMPRVLVAGEDAGRLTETGAKLLDPTGTLQPGIPFCPPEGDAGTGMTATNSVAPRTGNVSAGTSVFAQVVLEKPLSRVYTEIDPLTTPTGTAVAVVHSNNCTSDLNAWAGLFRQFAAACGLELSTNELYTLLFRAALEGAPDGGGLLSYNYESGEHLVGLTEGRPLFLRQPGQELKLNDFMRTQLMSALASLKVGMDILRGEHVQIDAIYGHGGYFKTPEAGQRILAAAIDTPVTVMETAGEGGAWGMALLAAYTLWREEGQSLEKYLGDRVFAGMSGNTVAPEPAEVEGFERYAGRFLRGMPVERAAVEYAK